MPVRGVSNAVCSHTHLLHPFCQKLPLTTRVSNAFFLALAVVIGAAIYYAINRSNQPKGPQTPTPNRNTPLTSGTAKPDRLPAQPSFKSAALVQPPAALAPLSKLRIQSINEIENISKIVGVPLKVIEQRARSSNNHRGETSRGFISDGDSIGEVIGTNWALAESAGVTHAEIAGHLRRIIEAAMEKPKTVICYNPRTGSTDPMEENIPRFQVSIRVKKDDPDTDIFRPIDAGPDVDASYEEAVIVNTALHWKYIRWTPVRERYIAEFGFYSTGMEFEKVLEVLMAQFK